MSEERKIEVKHEDGKICCPICGAWHDVPDDETLHEITTKWGAATEVLIDWIVDNITDDEDEEEE